MQFLPGQPLNIRRNHKRWKDPLIDSDRKKRIIEILSDSSFVAIICATPSEVLALTGYWPVMGASVAVFTSDGDVQVILPQDEVELAEKTSAAKLIPYKPSELSALTTPIKALADPLREVTTRLKLSSGTIGVELNQGMQPSSYAAAVDFRSSLSRLLRELHPNARLAACDGIIEAIESRKTSKELELIRKAAEVSDAGFAKAAKCIQAGERESEVAAAAQAAFEACTKAESLHRSYGFFFCMSGPNSALASAAYARTRQRRIEAGDLVMIHANTCADGYWTDVTRTYTAGPSLKRHQEMRSAIAEAREAALNSIHPGVAARNVDKAARSVMEAHGFGKEFKHSTGHGVGFAAANPNALPRIHPLSPDILEIGMTFNIEPAAYFDGYGGMRHCDVVAVSPNGATVLTDF